MSNENSFHIGLRLLLRPIAWYCLKHAIRLQELVEIAKQVLVDLGMQALEQAEEDVTNARLSVMTGVHRRDVVRLIGEQPKSTGSLVSRVLGQWQSDKQFLGLNGKPRQLSYLGQDNEFSILVHTVSKELNASLVLSELERVGAVKKQASKQGSKIKLINPLMVIKGDVVEALTLLAEDTQDLMAAVDENIEESDTLKNLHIKTEFDAIPDAKVQEIRRYILREGTKFHRELSAYIAAHDKDINHEFSDLPGRNRIAVGSFSIASVDTFNNIIKK